MANSSIKTSSSSSIDTIPPPTLRFGTSDPSHPSEGQAPKTQPITSSPKFHGGFQLPWRIPRANFQDNDAEEHSLPKSSRRGLQAQNVMTFGCSYVSKDSLREVLSGFRPDLQSWQRHTAFVRVINVGVGFVYLITMNVQPTGSHKRLLFLNLDLVDGHRTIWIMLRQNDCPMQIQKMFEA